MRCTSLPLFSEEKLKKVQRQSKENLKSSDILDSLAEQREKTLSHLTQSSSLENALTSQSPDYNYLERKIWPEKVAVDKEELEILLENDQLARSAEEPAK